MIARPANIHTDNPPYLRPGPTRCPIRNSPRQFCHIDPTNSVEDKPRDETGCIQSRQNGETGADRVTIDTVRGREKVSSGANFIFAFSDAMG